jgi:hypothetical protein
METVVLVIALWLILVGIYGALSLLSGAPSTARAARPRAERRPRLAEPRPSAPHVEPYGAPYNMEQQAPNAILSEVDLLRAQVRHLRSEIFAMADKPPVEIGSVGNKPKRYRGQPELPRPLRRHLRETRGVRTA